MGRESSNVFRVWVMFALVCITYMLIPFHRASPAVMADGIMRDLSLGAVEMGLLAAVFFVMHGVMQILGGLMTDSVGPRRLLPPMIFLSGVGCLVFAVADSLAPALAGRALMGFGVSSIFLCGLKLIGAWFPAGRFSMMTGILLSMGGVGAYLASAPLAAGCEAFGWRAVFQAGAFGSLVLALLLGVVVRDAPDGGERADRDPKAGYTASGMRSLVTSLILIVGHREFRLCCLWMFCNLNMNLSFTGLWGASYLKDVYGFSPDTVGSILGMTGLGIAVGGVVAGWLDGMILRSHIRTMFLTSCVMMSLFVLLICFDDLPVWSLYVWFTLNAAFGVPMHCASFAMVREMFPSELTGSASGLVNSIPCMGVLLYQPLAGAMLEAFPRTATGFAPEAYVPVCLMFIVTGAVAFASVLALALPRQRDMSGRK